MHFNLTQFSASLPEGQMYRPMKKLIRRLESLHAIELDLTTCEEHAGLIFQLISENGGRALSNRDAACERGLFQAAVLMYARSTDGATTSRSVVDVRKILSAAQVEEHRRIIGLRNQAIAHSGTYNHKHGNWLKEELWIERPGSEIGSTSISYERANSRAWATRFLQDACPTLINFVQNQRLRKDLELAKIIRQLPEETLKGLWMNGADFRNSPLGPVHKVGFRTLE